jgi:hypothetical protein
MAAKPLPNSKLQNNGNSMAGRPAIFFLKLQVIFSDRIGGTMARSFRQTFFEQ